MGTTHKHRNEMVWKRRTTKKQGEIMAVWWMRLTLWPLLFYTCYQSLIAVKSLYPPLGLPRLVFLAEKDDAWLNTTTTSVIPTPISSAQPIVQRTYEESFASIADRCPKDVNFRKCISEIASETETSNTTSRPWWLQKMFNDMLAPGRGFWGPWHDLTSHTPSLRMCAIEKIGTKHWRKLFEYLNADHMPTANLTHEQRVNPFRANGGAAPQPPPDAPHFVFLRDPLERFLSAYLDKCVSWHTIERNCEPLEVSNTTLLDGLTRQQQFAAYVDAMPLTWNLHFFPQSFYCDGLFRHLADYDFVGTMGPHLYQDLDALGKQFRLEEAVVKAFGPLPLNQTDNVGVETAAKSHVEEYYTAASVRRVLEYTAVDYVLLDLPVPDWAQRMLSLAGSSNSNKEGGTHQ